MAEFDDDKMKRSAELQGQPYFDAPLFAASADLFVRLDAARLAPHATMLMSPPSVEDRLEVVGTLRGLANSTMLALLAPDAVTVSRLQTLLMLLEGLCKPLIDVALELCEQCGLGGQDLKNARRSLSSAFNYLSNGAGAPVLASSSPGLVAEFKWASDDKIPQLRNGLAHFNLRLDTQTLPTAHLHKRLGFPDSMAEVASYSAGGLARLLGLRADITRYLDYDNSTVVYEEKLGKPLNQQSRRRPLPEIRSILTRVERLGFSMLFGLVCAASEHQRQGKVSLGGCVTCNEGTVCGLPGSQAICSFCGHTWTF